MTELQRFVFSLIGHIQGECWIAARSNHEFGYWTVTWKGRRTNAHVLAYESQNGPRPNRLSVLHKCSVPQCINPDHLYAGTQRQNMQDRKARGLYPPQIGEKNYCAKLREDDVRDIRKLCAFLHQYQVAEIFGISRTNVEAIHVRRSWSHIA